MEAHRTVGPASLAGSAEGKGAKLPKESCQNLHAMDPMPRSNTPAQGAADLIEDASRHRRTCNGVTAKVLLRMSAWFSAGFSAGFGRVFGMVWAPFWCLWGFVACILRFFWLPGGAF